MGNNLNSKKGIPVRKYTKPGHFLLRLAALALAAVVFVVYCDKKKFFITDQKNRHHEQRWESLYDLTPETPIDIVVLGNSHVNTGIEPSNLSCTLGCTAFDLAPSGTDIADSYYCLKELLTLTTPSLVIIETYLMRGTDGPITEGGGLADEYRSFYPRRNLGLKLQSLPVLFGVESYLPAWSFTLRNHELLLRNREEMKKNMQIYKDRIAHNDDNLYLGRFSRFKDGISDTIMSYYDTKGPAVDGRNERVSMRDFKYARKIVDLCDEKGIEVMFMTLPMYYRHIENYEAWRDEQSRVIVPTGKAWLNMQIPYDTVAFDKDCFESTYDENQHMTMIGSLIATYKLAHFINDVLKIDLPDRRGDKEWMKMFYGKDGYFENLPINDKDPNFNIVAKDIILEDEHIIECFQKDKSFGLKLDNDTKKGNDIVLLVEASVNNVIAVGRLDMYLSSTFDPIGHKYYTARLTDGVTVNRILGWVDPDLIGSE